MTCEPVENLSRTSTPSYPMRASATDICRTATELVEDYYTQIGGREFVTDEATKELEKVKTAPPRKRGRAASRNGVTPKGKKGKLEKHLKSTTPPALLDFKPPTGSWENEAMTVEQIEEEDDGTLPLNIVGREDTERCTSAV